MFVSALACLLLAAPAHADPLTPRPMVRQFSTQEGLPQSSVTTIVQSRDEHLWLGTYGGLARFDGQRFTTYPSVAREGPSSDRVSALLEDDRGQLWVGTEDAGLSVRVDDHFERLDVCGGSCRVYAIVAQPGQVLVATTAGLYSVDGAKHDATVVSPLIFAWGVAEAGGAALFATPQEIRRYDMGKLVSVPLPPGSGTVGLLTALDGEPWLARGEAIYRRKGEEWLRVAPERSWPSVNLLLRDGAGGVWVSRLQGELVRIAADGHVEPAGVDAGTLTSGVYADGSVWLGSSARGLFRVQPGRVAYLRDPAVGLDLPGLAVTDDGAGGHWVGVNCDGLRHLDAEGRVVPADTLDAGAAGCPWALRRAPGGRLWVGTTDGRLGFVADGRVSWVHAWSALDRIGTIHAVSDAELLVAAGTSTSRVTVAEDGSVSVAPIAALNGMQVIRIVPARAGGRWFVGDRGAVRVVDDAVAERLDTGLSTRFVRALVEEADGTVLLGTYGGGLDVLRGGKVARVQRAATGLREDVISCILDDAYGNLWLAGNRGVSRVDAVDRSRLATDAVEARPVGAAGGFLDETNGPVDPACHQDPDGRLWFPLLSGFAVLTPEPGAAPGVRPPSPAPVIDAVSIAGRTLDPRAVVDVRSGEQNLLVDVSAASLSAPEDTRVRFRLSLDTGWTELGAGRRVLYPRLPWGEYDLEISARVAGRDWSAPARVHIVDPVPWYWRPAAWVALVVVSGLAAVGIEWAVRAWLHRRNARFVEAVGRRAGELERDNRELATLARTDPLTGLLNRRGFMEQLAASWGRPFSVLALDVDDFKRFNDQYGHNEGDECLRAVGRLLQANVREGTVVGRVGGEEFVVLTPGASSEQALALAHRLLTAMRAAAIPAASSARHPVVTFSIGCATWNPRVDTDAEALLARADRAMYDAKAGGRDRVCVSAMPPPG